jgi:hypothetical protein
MVDMKKKVYMGTSSTGLTCSGMGMSVKVDIGDFHNNNDNDKSSSSSSSSSSGRSSSSMNDKKDDCNIHNNNNNNEDHLERDDLTHCTRKNGDGL